MWLIVLREPRPDVPYWPGRRWVAMADALAWPLVLTALLERAVMHTGIVGPVGVALMLLWAFFRMRRALWFTHRYRFTTWQLAKPLLVLLVLGWVVRQYLLP